MDYRYFILQDLEYLQTKLAMECKSVCKSANRPSRSHLMITEERGKIKFVAVSIRDGIRKRRTINDDRERIYRLANKKYIEELARRLRWNKELLDKAIKGMLPTDYNSILRALPKNYDLLDPNTVVHPETSAADFFYPNPSRDVEPAEVRLSLGNMDPWEWAAMPYCENTDHLENKTHHTRNGLYCRSKSEALIFEIYMSLGLPFHYDETMLIGSRLISPDFNGPRFDGRIIFHEHCGLHSEEYRSRNDWKSGLYAVADIYPGDNLIYTYDDPNGNINVKLVEAIIKDAYKL